MYSFSLKLCFEERIFGTTQIQIICKLNLSPGGLPVMTCLRDQNAGLL
jgi:hypothetical protein